MAWVSVLRQKTVVIRYLPVICCNFVLQTLILSSTFSCCYLTPFAYFLQPHPPLYISSTNYGEPCQMSFCSLSTPFQTLSSFSYSILVSFYQLILCPLTPSIFFSTPFVSLHLLQFITKYSSEYLPHKRQACYWSKYGDIISPLTIFHM